MNNRHWIRLGLHCAAGLAMLMFAAPLAAQDRSESDYDRDRSQQTRDQSQRDDARDRDRQRDQRQYSDQTEYRDQSDYRTQGSREETDREQAAGLGVTLMETRDGVRIRQVLPDSPAERAGLRTGDLLLSVDDERVRTARGTEQTIRDKEPGAWVDLEVWRNGQRQTIEAKLASRQQAFRDQGPQMPRQGFSQPGSTTPRQGFSQEGNFQGLAQQIQSLQRQLAQLRQEVDQLRSGRQALRPTYEEEPRFDDRNRSLEPQRQGERGSTERRSDDRRSP
jgi:hypothetical protein